MSTVSQFLSFFEAHPSMGTRNFFFINHNISLRKSSICHVLEISRKVLNLKKNSGVSLLLQKNQLENGFTCALSLGNTNPLILQACSLPNFVPARYGLKNII